MCGRFTLKTHASSWVEQLFPGMQLLDLPELPPRYNIAPTQPILAIVAPHHESPRPPSVRGVMMRWGLIPPWADDLSIGNRMINARSETLSEKPSFRKAFAERRCLIVADGYYEWKTGEGKAKRPFWIHRHDGSPFLMAGLWEMNRKISRDLPILSTTIITTDSNTTTRPVHDRMPVIIDANRALEWLDPSNEDTKSLQSWLQPAPEDWFQLTEVGTDVNSPKNDGPSLLAPLLNNQESNP